MLIYICISFFILVASLIPKDTYFNNKYVSRSIVFMLIGTIIIYIPSWDLYFSDMASYVQTFQSMADISLSQSLNSFSWEPLFLIVQWLLSKISMNPPFFVISVFLIYTIVLYRTIKIFFYSWQRMYVMFLFLCSPFFHNYIFNGVRQGLAMMFLLLAMSYWKRKPNSFKFYCALIIAGLFHYTSFIFALLLFIVLKLQLNLRTIISIWSVTALLFLTGQNSQILNFSFITNIDYIERYASSTYINIFGGEINNISFFAFSTFFFLVSIFLYKNIDLDDKIKNTYCNIIKIYLAFNSVFLLFGFIAYSNRLAVYSWHMIPLLVIYPILYNKGYSNKLLFLILLIGMIVGIVTSPFIQYG